MATSMGNFTVPLSDEQTKEATGEQKYQGSQFVVMYTNSVPYHEVEVKLNKAQILHMGHLTDRKIFARDLTDRHLSQVSPLSKLLPR